MTYCPTGWAGRLFLRTPVPHEPYIGFEPDILLSHSESLDLAPYGIPGTIKSMRGHTAGSISVDLSTGDALVGDLVASGILIGGIARRARPIRPPFEDDPRAVAVALENLLATGVERFHLGHGGPLKADAVRRHARILNERFGHGRDKCPGH